jgi:S-DNA-T family DNA segregation ATPase FtsK/SpoIIIE
MSERETRRLAAVTALVLGAFAALALLPVPVTGPFGEFLRSHLWRLFGVGALCVPLLGLGLALAGFDRLPHFDMKRIAALIGGMALILPFLAGVVGRVEASDFLAASPADWPWAARLSGLLPGFLARLAHDSIGLAGGVLVGFLALSALTLVTIAWHPLQRLEGGAAAPPDPEAEARAIAAEGRSRKKRVPEPEPVPEPATERVDTAPAAPVAAAGAALAKAAALAAKLKRPKKEVEADEAPAVGLPQEDQLPPIELLSAPPAQDVDAGEAQLDRLGQTLIETLRTFRVEGRIAGRTTGPVVTQFEIVPAPGVKVGRIAALADDLALAMHAPSIRIVAPIPGKGAVGVEVPNPTARVVTLRELIATPEWDRARSALPIALGRDLEGSPVVADLAKMPHLLIAGATGSGKSVAINTIVTSLVYRYTPAELRFLMIDPKMVELSAYAGLPHLRHKVVTNNHEAAAVLKWAVFEMGRRYELLHANGARNLADFNRKVSSGAEVRLPDKPRPTLSVIAAEAEPTAPEPQGPVLYDEGPLPYIVVVVDELADLMMTVPGEVETPLAMLAQKARAIGIHLILATQRPSVNVITGLIKANFSSRIAFRVASKVDSRTILDQNGAEALLGNGDMLFLPPGKSEPMRLQGAFIATEEIERVMEWYHRRREQRALAEAGAEPDILEQIRLEEAEGDGTGGSEPGERDPLFREAAEVCIQQQGGSTSLLQRKLRIGYGRAARIIDQLHEAGILGPPDGSKPREVLIGIGQLDEYAS